MSDSQQPQPRSDDDNREDLLMPPASPRAPALLLDDDGLPLQVSADEQESTATSSADDYTRSLSPEPETEAEREEREAAASAADAHGDALSPLGGALGVIEEATPSGADGEEAAPHVSGPGAPSGGQMESTGAEMDDAPEPVSLEESVQLGVEPSTPEGQAAQQPLLVEQQQAPSLRQPPQQTQQMLSPFTPGNRVIQVIDPTQYAQLRRNVPRPKPRQYAFDASHDADTLPHEIDEFYSYVEAPQIAENRAAWEEWCGSATTLNKSGSGSGSGSGASPAVGASNDEAGGLGLGFSTGSKSPRDVDLSEWIALPTSARRRTVAALLTQLEVRDPMTRQRASRALLYLLQGAFADTRAPEHQLQWMCENARTVRTAGGVGEIYAALRLASWKHDWLSALPENIPSSEPAPPDGPPPAPLLTPQAKLEYLDEINLELALHFAQLYILVETQRGEEEWGDELMSLDPPLPIYLFGLVASLREKNAKGYPVKKLLLLLWKTLLCCFGGNDDIRRCKELSRELEGLPSEDKPRHPPTKSTPLDFSAFVEEIAAKYPTYEPPRSGPGQLPTERMASAVTPMPVRRATNGAPGGDAAAQVQQPGTPAPSPPPSPKPSKQKFQTDQSRPFVFPFSRSVQGARMVPYSVEDAARLYRESMHVSLELWQTYKLREECLKAERAGGEPTGGSEANERLATLEAELDAELTRAEADHMTAALDNARYLQTCNRLQQKRADCRRLQRVDAFYTATLPQLQNGVVVLLKLLLATVTQQSSTNSPHAQALAEGVAPEDVPLPTLEDIDIVRHREITSKAVSAILLLCLRWFKTNHAMKFAYLSQLLVDSNCLLLILKMFGLQEVGTTVRAQNEAPNFNFFRYCELHCGREPRQPRPEDALPGPLYGRPSSPPPPGGVANVGQPGDAVELITSYSFRNLYAALSFTRILQKLTKRKVHRILLLVQYKSSAILKRTLKVAHPALQRYALKVIKSQVPFCGRKWRQSNMKVITAIYLHLRPDLREDWLSGADVDTDVEESLPQEQALRALVKHYNTAVGASAALPAHRRALSGSLGDGAPAAAAAAAAAAAQGGTNAAAPASPTRQIASFFEADHLPPLRRHAERTAGTLRYIPDDLLDGYLDDYEDVLGEVFGGAGAAGAGATGFGTTAGAGGQEEEGWGGDSTQAAWARLGEILGDADSISDSESIATLGDLTSDGTSDPTLPPPGAQSWEHLSPKEMRFLARPSTPGSPTDRAHRRRSSSSAGSSGSKSRSNSDSSPLRPVLAFGPELLEDEAVGGDEEEEEEEELQPLATPQAGGIDEVEHVFGR